MKSKEPKVEPEPVIWCLWWDALTRRYFAVPIGASSKYDEKKGFTLVATLRGNAVAQHELERLERTNPKGPPK